MARDNNLALAILTFSDGSHTRLRQRLSAALDSLRRTAFPGHVFIVDDGSTDSKHREYLQRLRGQYCVEIRPQRGGIARAKNTCLRLLRDSGCGFGFVVEDDCLFLPGWWAAYHTAHLHTGVHHFCWSSSTYYGKGRQVRTVHHIGRGKVLQTSMLNGVLMTVTPAILEQVGGFKVLPHHWGHEHTNFTNRCIKAGLAPFWADIDRAEEYIRLNEFYRTSAFSSRQRQQGFEQNRHQSRDLRNPQPILE